MMRVLLREWGAVTFVATVILGAIAVTVSLLFSGAGATPSTAPLLCPSPVPGVVTASPNPLLAFCPTPAPPTPAPPPSGTAPAGPSPSGTPALPSAMPSTVPSTVPSASAPSTPSPPAASPTPTAFPTPCPPYPEPCSP